MLDSFFGSLGGDGDLHRGVSDRGFAKARDRLSWNALQRLNSFVVQTADRLGLIARWRGLRVVAADASVFFPAVRACPTLKGFAASPNQRLFSLFLPGAELTLYAQVHGEHTAERQMLFEALEQLGPDDVLVLDRGYPATWLVAYLNEHKIRFCMRCDKPNGWQPMRALLCSGQAQVKVTLRKPNHRDVQDYLCSGAAPLLRLVRHVTPDGKVWVLATNLPEGDFPPAVFGDLYHQRWRIEESYKRLKHRLKLETVSGLAQHAVLIDVYAKVLADNLHALVCMGVIDDVDLATNERHCNQAYAGNCLQRMLPRLVMGLECLASLLQRAFGLLGANSHKRRPGRKAARPNRHVKPHPNMAYKG
nr:IS4 family transposase [uncultured Rhodoferax sp.]